MTPSGRRGEILAYLRRKAGRPLTAEELATELGVREPEIPSFRAQIQEMETIGLLYRGRGGRLALPANLNLVVGRLQVTRAGDGFVLPESGEGADVFVPQRDLGTAVEGDTVVARIERRRRGKNPAGRVVRILRRAWTTIVGTYRSRRGYGFVTPREPPLAIEIFIPPDGTGEAADGELVAVEIVDWGESEPNPVGRITRRLGRPGEPGVDVLAIILGHELPLEFPREVERAATRIARRGIRPEDLEGREDFREDLVLTIDPEDARDHDDALSVRRAPEGGLQIGVHIADVSFYVKPADALDREARERGTSVYLVDRVVPMLPEALSSDLCSLVPGEDRLTLSVLFDVDDRGSPGPGRVVRGVVRSGHRLSYERAQALMEGREKGPRALVEALAALRRVAAVQRKERRERGSIDFDLPESRVILNAAGEPTDVQRILRLESHRIVEDLMILANETVARLALRRGLPILFRVHEEPDAERMDALRTLAATFEYRLPRRRIRPLDLARLVEAMTGTPQEGLVSTVTLRSMKQARYAQTNLGHFGLASEAYAHFTSPIRRYPDLHLHRALVRGLGRRGRRGGSASPGDLDGLAIHASARERRAVAAERESVALKKTEFMERHLGDEFPGTIAGVTAFGFFVLLSDYDIEGLVRVSSLGDDYYALRETEHALVGRRRKRRFRLGDPVTVRVARVDREAHEVDLALVDAPLDRR
ncbi:MAG: ribonuclease R [Gemmatimonadota bacterium]